ncbi:DUF4231 domain-containing protein [Acidisoma sp. L85]|uniref:DUF4231 domain-containing protein n=1 Tax=Acidisoma sp. L85 TaxID=1641850 RepID=UPI00131D4C68|nr:DUF4231 domain-containing protein [Acidisoma sp. L85]
MIETAWDEYRGWAKRARMLQASSKHWNTAAFAAAGAAAILGCAAGQVGAYGWESRVLAFMAAAAAGATPVLGRDMLDIHREADWICARATAESIKSECFRFAARLGPYAQADAVAAFVSRRAQLADQATRSGITPLTDTASGNDARCPPETMTRDWYMKNRLRAQREDFFRVAQQRHERSISHLRLAIVATALLGTIIGAAAATFRDGWLAPWVAVLASLGGLFAAYGLLDRRQFLAANYAAMAAALSRIEETAVNDISSLVEMTETLLEAEHAAWVARLTKSIPSPPSVPALAKPTELT